MLPLLCLFSPLLRLLLPLHSFSFSSPSALSSSSSSYFFFLLFSPSSFFFSSSSSSSGSCIFTFSSSSFFSHFFSFLFFLHFSFVCFFYFLFLSLLLFPRLLLKSSFSSYSLSPAPSTFSFPPPTFLFSSFSSPPTSSDLFLSPLFLILSPFPPLLLVPFLILLLLFINI